MQPRGCTAYRVRCVKVQCTSIKRSRSGTNRRSHDSPNRVSCRCRILLSFTLSIMTQSAHAPAKPVYKPGDDPPQAYVPTVFQPSAPVASAPPAAQTYVPQAPTQPSAPMATTYSASQNYVPQTYVPQASPTPSTPSTLVPQAASHSATPSGAYVNVAPPTQPNSFTYTSIADSYVPTYRPPETQIPMVTATPIPQQQPQYHQQYQQPQQHYQPQHQQQQIAEQVAVPLKHYMQHPPPASTVQQHHQHHSHPPQSQVNNQRQVYKIRENMWSMGDNFQITDQQGRLCYQVRNKLFSFNNQLSLRNAQDQKVAYISSQFGFQPRYEILDATKQRRLASITKEWTFFNKKFTMMVGNQRIVINGNFFSREYTFVSGNQLVARVSKKVFSWTDSYSVEIMGGIDATIVLCACIVVDQVLHDDN